MRTGKFDATRTSRPRISNGLMTKGVTLRPIMGWEALEGLPTAERERLVATDILGGTGSAALSPETLMKLFQ